MKRLLLVTPRWVPHAAPDLQRVRLSLPYYRSCGWDPVILCIDPKLVDGTLEPELATTVPDDIRVYTCSALPQSWTRPLGLGSLGLRAFPSLLEVGLNVISREKIDLVFVSTTEFLATSAARRWSEITGVPYVIDLQDPWRTTYYEQPGAPRPPGGWKYQFARGIAWSLEEWSFSRARGFISVSPRYLEELGSRYRWFAQRPSAVVPFGSSSDDFDAAAQVYHGRSAIKRVDPGEVHLVYTGAIGPALPHGIAAFFSGCQQYLERHPQQRRHLRIHFVGTHYRSTGSGSPELMEAARRYGVESLVTEIPHRVGYLESLQWQREADALLLVGSPDLAYSPSKLFTYLRAGKPILALVFPDSHLETLLEETGGAHLVRFGHSVRLEHSGMGVAHFLSDVCSHEKTLRRTELDRTLLETRFGQASLCAQQCALFERSLSPEFPPLTP
ncbi:MAG TPA: glycosyltransferase [Opitutaceae bacterium]|nr:glycosyltransferase [Opitutaceae bacterium]